MSKSTTIDTAATMRGRYRITVEMRPPLAGERGWWVDEFQIAADALDEVIAGHCDAAGYGWPATMDYDSTPDTEDMIAITVVVVWSGRPFSNATIRPVRGCAHRAPVPPHCAAVEAGAADDPCDLDHARRGVACGSCAPYLAVAL